MRYFSFKLLFVLVVTSLFFNCAKRGAPTGGAKDSIPPIMVKAFPKNETVNFKGNKIKIYFDEYIKLNKVNQNLIISPPQKHEPIITPVGTASKIISIKIQDTLDPNTTYSYNFGNSIVDNNEGNELGNFKYVFSTGTYIDSLSILGEVTNPMIKKSVTNLDVLLYEYDSTFTDSIIFKEKPRYIANTLDSTLFEITNIRAGNYLLIALNDANNNKIYNPEVDQIGFIKDTIKIPTEEQFNFTIFKEIPPLKVFRPKEVSKGHLIFGYEGNAKNLKIEFLSNAPENFKSHYNFEEEKDTINFYYAPFEADSLNFSVTDGDYLEELTVKLRSTKLDSLTVTKSTSSILKLLDTFSISTNNPIVNFDASLIKIIDQDSTTIDFNSILSESKTKLYIDFDKKDNTTYNFEILPKTITDIFEFTNDSLIFNIKTKSPKDYGILNIDLQSDRESSFIVELLDSKENVIRSAKIKKPEPINFSLLEPAKYFVRVTIDQNNNGKWDTGNFLKKQQPEFVKFFSQEIEIRANWELNETFTIN